MHFSGIYQTGLPNYRPPSSGQHETPQAGVGNTNSFAVPQATSVFQNRFPASSSSVPWTAVPPPPFSTPPRGTLDVAPANQVLPTQNLSYDSKLNYNESRETFASNTTNMISSATHVQTNSNSFPGMENIIRHRFTQPPPFHLPPPAFNVPPPGAFPTRMGILPPAFNLPPPGFGQQFTPVPAPLQPFDHTKTLGIADQTVSGGFSTGNLMHQSGWGLPVSEIRTGQVILNATNETGDFGTNFTGSKTIVPSSMVVRQDFPSIVNEMNSMGDMGNFTKIESGGGQATESLQKHENAGRKAGAEWIENWIQSKGLVQKKKSHLPSKNLSLTAFRNLILEAISLNDKLKEIVSGQHVERTRTDKCADDLVNSHTHVICNDSHDEESMDDSSLNLVDDKNDRIPDRSCANGAMLDDSVMSSPSPLALQKRLKEIQSMLNDKVIFEIKNKLKNIDKKRKRLKRKRQLEYNEKEDRLSARAKIDQEIDNWQKEILAEHTKIKKDKEIKMAADETLCEVRRKLTEARRCFSLLESIQKLRDIRKDKAIQKGMLFSTDSDDTFQERFEAQKEILKRQIDMYDLEERTLEVMLETEQEANIVREKKLQKKKEDEKIQKFEKQLRTWLFGKEESLSPLDALYPYRQYYGIGSSNLSAFIRIRQEWDMYAVPHGMPGGSTVPFGWIAPVEPSSDTWALALKE